MLALALHLAALIAQSPAARRCEELGPRLDHSYVAVCDGSVVSVRDRHGNIRAWNPRNRTITTFSPGVYCCNSRVPSLRSGPAGHPPMVLPR